MSFINAVYSIDFSILDFIQSTIKCAFLDPIMLVLSYMGDKGAIWLTVSIIMLFFKRTRAIGAMSLCAVIAGYLIGELGIKHLVNRPRPFMENTDIILNIKAPSGSSFPSGHTCSSFAAATVMLLRNRRIGIPAIILAVLIAFSRLYNYVHFPSDVLSGMILGIACAFITVFIFKKTGAEKRLSPKI